MTFSFQEWKSLLLANNHKVVSVESDGFEDVYDISVDEYHNFALESGIFVHNCFPFGGSANVGSIMLPEVGATVWVAFEMGFIGKPVWLGGWYGTLEPPAEFLTNPAQVRMIRTPWGHTLLFDDTSGSERILIESGGVNSIELKDSPAGGTISAVTTDGDRSLVLDDVTSSVILQDTPTCKITMDATQLLVQAAAGSSIAIDLATGNITVLTVGTISLGTGAAKGVALDSLLTILNNFIGIFNAHTHAYNPGPGGPTPTAGPVAPGVPGVSGTDTSLTVFAKV